MEVTNATDEHKYSLVMIKQIDPPRTYCKASYAVSLNLCLCWTTSLKEAYACPDYTWKYRFNDLTFTISFARTWIAIASPAYAFYSSLPTCL